MTVRPEFPKVLLVSVSRLHEEDHLGVSLRQWFGGWPKDRLAQIYSGGEINSAPFCGATLKLGPEERRFGRFFFRLKNATSAERTSGLDLMGRTPSRGLESRRGLDAAAGLIQRTGIWEIIFPPRLSVRLRDWVRGFSPDVIYCQGYNLTFATLPVLLRERLGIPLLFQTGDDWPEYLYRDTVLAPLVRPLVKHAASRLLRSAAVRLTNGARMNEEYSRRYGGNFHPLMMCDSPTRFENAVPVRVAPLDTVSIVYSGNMGHMRWRSLVDLAAALDGRLRAHITIFASLVSDEAVSSLSKFPNVSLRPAPSHEALPGILKGADILFLPEAFDSREASRVSLSISTKAHLYMLSRRPVVVYGSPECGVVDYALRERWAVVVKRQDRRDLLEAVSNIVERHEAGNLVEAAAAVAARNHDEGTVRQHFQDYLRRAAAAHVAAKM